MATNRKRRGRGESSIYFREADQRWVGSSSFGYDGQGKRIRRTVYGATKKEAQDKLDDLRATSGQVTAPSLLTVGEWLDRWLANTAKNKTRSSTFANYDRHVRLHLKPAIGSVKLAKLGAVHVEQLYAGLERNAVTANTRRAAGVVLSMALRHAVRLKLIPHNPAGDVARARPADREPLVLDDAQARRFLDAAKGDRLHALFALALASGMRQGELLALRWPDIDFNAATVSVCRSLSQVGADFIVKEPKSKAGRRTITLPRFALHALQSHRAAMLVEGNINATVFCNRDGNFIAKSNLVRRDFRNVLARAGKGSPLPPIRFHDLRHSHATSLLSKRFSPKAVSVRLGHTSIDITLRVYGHVLRDDDAKLAEGLESTYG